ncbi:hypothetical protein [uncultured Treponema sp.]|uniref:hypothetical protein n=1 Tax=uncultured Treponema sp. TaxID=162155 RepID=UPI00280B497F|nr:hypothetical protein [uncultured Treponema sp.]
MTDEITRLAYLNTLEENKKPLDLLLETIEIECYNYDFDSLGIFTTGRKSIADIIKEKYSIEIEEYILKRWVSNKFELRNRKLKLSSSNENLENKVKRIENGERGFLEQVSGIRENFKDYALSEFKIKYSNEQAKKIFNSYLYTVAKEKNVKAQDSKDYFIFQSFLSYSFENNRNDSEIIENFGIANQIQDLVLNGETDKPDFLKGCIIFLDTPIIMKRLGYDGIELSDVYKNFFEDLKKAGATLKVFEHTFEELWGILFNFKRCVAQNIFDAKGVNTFLKARKSFLDERNEELSLTKEIIRDNIKNLDIEIFDISADDNVENTTDFSAWEFNADSFRKHIISEDESYEKFKARLDKDVQSITAISRLRQREGISKIDSFEDGKYYLLVDNYALVNAIKAYYKELEKKSKKNELLLENTIIFNLWQNLSNNSELNKSLFRSKCFALNTIDEKFKDTLYRETRKIEAYNADVEINQQLVNNPLLENEVFAESIKDNKFDKEYIAKTLLNTISKKENELKNQHQEELNMKDADIQQKENENKALLLDKEKQSECYLERLNKQKIDAELEKKEYLKTYNETRIARKIEILRKNFIIKIQLFFRKFNKDFSEYEFLRKKACYILEIDCGD